MGVCRSVVICAFKEVEANNNCPCPAVISPMQTFIYKHVTVYVFMYLSKFTLEQCQVRGAGEDDVLTRRESIHKPQPS